MEFSIFALAHEIKNPLAVSKGYLEMINERNLNNYKLLIEENIIEALNILDEYLIYNKLVINCEIMDIIMLFEEISSKYRKIYNLEFKIITIYDELYINADYEKLLQVFNNIIKNSIEAHADLIKVYVKIINNNVNIRIVDNGDGLTDLNVLNGYTTKINGHGIGLSVVRSIIELHSGSVVYDNLHKGLSINISLPINI